MNQIMLFYEIKELRNCQNFQKTSNSEEFQIVIKVEIMLYVKIYTLKLFELQFCDQKLYELQLCVSNL